MKTIMQEFIDILEIKLMLNNQKIIYHIDVDYFLRKEKEQIIKTFDDCKLSIINNEIIEGEQYYNKTFKKNKKL
jgi:hypothetical protein